MSMYANVSSTSVIPRYYASPYHFRSLHQQHVTNRLPSYPTITCHTYAHLFLYPVISVMHSICNECVDLAFVYTLRLAYMATCLYLMLGLLCCANILQDVVTTCSIGQYETTTMMLALLPMLVYSYYNMSLNWGGYIKDILCSVCSRYVGFVYLLRELIRYLNHIRSIAWVLQHAKGSTSYRIQTLSYTLDSLDTSYYSPHVLYPVCLISIPLGLGYHGVTQNGFILDTCATQILANVSCIDCHGPSSHINCTVLSKRLGKDICMREAAGYGALNILCLLTQSYHRCHTAAGVALDLAFHSEFILLPKSSGAYRLVTLDTPNPTGIQQAGGNDYTYITYYA